MEQLAYSIDEAAKILGVGKTKLYSELATGRLSGRKLGKRTIITRESLDQFLANLEPYNAENAGA